MTRSKLIIVEGVWGSGKSTTAQLICNHLTEVGKKTRLFLEGDLDHPADYDKVACLTNQEYSVLLEKHSALIGLIRSITQSKSKYNFIDYGKRKQELGNGLPDDLLADVIQYDIYDGTLPLERHCEVHLDRWSGFVQAQQQEEMVTIFECCFIQNPPFCNARSV